MTPAKASVSRMLDFEMPIREQSARILHSVYSAVTIAVSAKTARMRRSFSSGSQRVPHWGLRPQGGVHLHFQESLGGYGNP